MYCIYLKKVFKEMNDEIESIKREIEEYFNRNYGEEIRLDYNIIEDYEGKFCACVDNNNDVRFNLEFINDVYRCLFNRISNINPNDDKILKDVMRTLLNCILVHESHHFYYKKYRTEEYSKLKDKDVKQNFRKDMALEVLADKFMVNFMADKGDLHFMIAGLVEKFNQMKPDGYTKDDRINDIVEQVRKIYILNSN